MTQWNTAEALGISPSKIRVICHYLGGGFGCKGSAWPHTWLAAQVARLIGRPVKLVVSRDQMSTTVGWREEQVHRMTLTANATGDLTGLRHVKTSTTSPFDDFAEPSCNISQMLYACPNVETSYRLARVNAMTPVFVRGTGGYSGCYALESALDELAYELSIDPVELRLHNHADVDPRTGARWSSKSLKQCYDVAGKRLGWDERDPRPRSMTRDGLLVGYGMARQPSGQSTGTDGSSIRLITPPVQAERRTSARNLHDRRAGRRRGARFRPDSVAVRLATPSFRG
jgi:xanthine dehydrogenase YagR molybdenum-binding subunit